MNLLDNTLTWQISGGYAVTLLPYIQVEMIFLNTESTQTFSVHACCIWLHGNLHFDSRERMRVQSWFSLTNAWIKGMLKGTTLTFSTYKHFPGRPHLYLTEPTLCKIKFKNCSIYWLSDKSLLRLIYSNISDLLIFSMTLKIERSKIRN